jgi:hypothetical protein
MSNIGPARARLNALSRQLHAQWKETSKEWRDGRAEEFEQKYLIELLDGVGRAATILEDLDKALTKVKKDCE